MHCIKTLPDCMCSISVCSQLVCESWTHIRRRNSRFNQSESTLYVVCRDTAGQRVVLAQVFLDQFVHHPLLYFPAFYCLKEGMESGEPLRGLHLYAENVRQTLLTAHRCH
eukprot:COSAG06_NODE_1798_length_8368_cov_4.946668_7_plen_110_part_00